MRVAQSGHLQSYDYDPNTGTLTIEFHNGAVYTYANVPQEIFDALAQNGGAGTFFWSNIRYQYPTTKIVGPRGR